MTGKESRIPNELFEAVRETENVWEEELRERALINLVFHPEHQIKALEELTLDDLEHLRVEFLEDKRGKNMGERFDMALSQKYLGKIHVVELGMTTRPASNGAVDGLRDEYLDLLRWMQANGIVERELTRDESQRNVDIRPPRYEPARQFVAVMGRNRPLVNTRIVHKDQAVTIQIMKRMVFSIPLMTVRPLLHLGGNDLNDPNALEQLEVMLHHGSGGIRPIRTTYYLATDIE